MQRFHPAGFREAVFCGCRVGVGGPPFWPRERRSKVRRTPGTRDERERKNRRRERVCKEGKAFAAGDAISSSSSAPFILFFSFVVVVVVGTLLPCSPGQQCSHISLIFVANHKIRWSVLRA